MTEVTQEDIDSALKVIEYIRDENPNGSPPWLEPLMNDTSHQVQMLEEQI